MNPQEILPPPNSAEASEHVTEADALTRRAFMQQASCAAVALSASMAGCGLLDDPELALVHISELQQKGYYSTDFNGDAIIALLDSNAKPYILSMVCTHKACTVRYDAQKQQFRCPCHKGLYDRNGLVLHGKPPLPLPRYRYEIREGVLWVLNQKLK